MSLSTRVIVLVSLVINAVIFFMSYFTDDTHLMTFSGFIVVLASLTLNDDKSS